MGHFLQALVENELPASGFDIAEEAVRGASLRTNSSVLASDANQPWPYPDESFGAVTMFDVIEHLPDYRRALAEANRVLEAEGYLFVVTVNWSSFLRFLLRSRWGGTQDPEHVVYFDRKSLAAAFRTAGFEIRESHTLFNLSVAGETTSFLKPFRSPGILVFLPELGDSIYAVGQKP